MVRKAPPRDAAQLTPQLPCLVFPPYCCWVRSRSSRCNRLLESLSALGARYYKLTPPLSPVYAERGHGFHFVVGEQDEEFYLDVMGSPPRVPTFALGQQNSRMIATDWGDVPTIGIQDLVEIKKTQRASDYPVIDQLVLRYLQERALPTTNDCLWAIKNVFTLPELRELLSDHPQVVDVESGEPLFCRLAQEIKTDALVSDETEQAVERLLAERTLAHQAEDRRYWREIIMELRELRKENQLMPLGAPVTPK